MIPNGFLLKQDDDLKVAAVAALGKARRLLPFILSLSLLKVQRQCLNIPVLSGLEAPQKGFGCHALSILSEKTSQIHISQPSQNNNNIPYIASHYKHIQTCLQTRVPTTILPANHPRDWTDPWDLPGGWRHHPGAFCGFVALGQVPLRARCLDSKIYPLVIRCSLRKITVFFFK